MGSFLISNLPIILCIIFGAGMIVLEAFMPGFGLPGISGILLEIAAIVLTFIHYGAAAALGVTLIVLSIVAIILSISLRSAAKGRLSKSEMILHATEDPEGGYVASEDLKVFIGHEGVTTTALRPAGIAEFDEVRLNVISEGEYIESGRRVRIISTDGSQVTVREINGN
jgi:membrane-bound ClpP family serine protease